MFEKVCMRALGAVEKIFSLVSFRFGVCRIAIWVWHFGSLAEAADSNGKPLANEGGDGGCGDNVPL